MTSPLLLRGHAVAFRRSKQVRHAGDGLSKCMAGVGLEVPSRGAGSNVNRSAAAARLGMRGVSLTRCPAKIETLDVDPSAPSQGLSLNRIVECQCLTPVPPIIQACVICHGSVKEQCSRPTNPPTSRPPTSPFWPGDCRAKWSKRHWVKMVRMRRCAGLQGIQEPRERRGTGRHEALPTPAQGEHSRPSP
jgi:hypothetical protein